MDASLNSVFVLLSFLDDRRYEQEHVTLEQERSRQEDELERLRQLQRRLVDQSEVTYRARQEQLSELRRKYKEAQQQIYDQMRTDSTSFSSLTGQNNELIAELEKKMSKTNRRAHRLNQRQSLLQQREQLVEHLHAEYKANAAQLAHDYAAAAVEKVETECLGCLEEELKEARIRANSRDPTPMKRTPCKNHVFSSPAGSASSARRLGESFRSPRSPVVTGFGTQL